MEELLDMVRINRQKSSWSKKQTFNGAFEELIGEIKEVESALENDNMDNLREELGDVLWDLLSLFAIAEDKELFNSKEIVENIKEKIKRRKPWIFTGEKLTSDEEVRRWNETKKLEKKM